MIAIRKKTMTLPALTLLCLGTLACAAEREAEPGAAEKVPITSASEEAIELYLEGTDLAEKLRAADARERYQAAAAADPDFALAHLGLANTAPTAQEFFGSLNRAVELVDRVSDGERHMILGLQAGAMGDPAAQQQHYSELVNAYPGDERAQNLLAGLYFGLQDYELAIEHYRRATDLDPEYSPPYNSMGYAFRFVDNYAEAEKAFQKYIELIPDEPNPYDSYAELLMKMGRFEESIQNYQMALSKNPGFNFSYVGIGNNQLFLGRPEEARATFQTLFELARNDGERRQAVFWTAVSYLHQGDYDAAMASIEKMYGIAEATDDKITMAGDLNLLGNILLEKGDLEAAAAKYGEAVAMIEQAEVSEEVKANARRNSLFNQARVEIAKGDLPAAQATAEEYRRQVQAKRVPFEVRQVHELAGTMALERGEYDAALTELAQANQQNPRVLFLQAVACKGQGDEERMREFGAKAADFNGLNINYAYVKPKAEKLLAGG